MRALHDCSSRSARSTSSGNVILMLSAIAAHQPRLQARAPRPPAPRRSTPSRRRARRAAPDRERRSGTSAASARARALARHRRLHAIARRRRASAYRRPERRAARPRRRRRARRSSAQIGGRRHGRAASCTSTQSSSVGMRASARKPARTESTRSAPPVAVDDLRMRAPAAARDQWRSCSASTTTMRSQSRASQERRERPFDDGAAGELQVLLRHARLRRPLPAASCSAAG